MTDSSTQNFSNMPSSTSYGTAPVGTTPVAPQPAQHKNVDMTGGTPEVTTPEAEAIAEESPKAGSFDTNALTSLQSSYIQANKFYFNMPTPAFVQSHIDPDIETCFGSSLKDQALLTNNFKKSILRNQRDKENFYEATQRFANLDQVNYKYSHHPILGDIRIRIDENGKEIGLPESIDINGSPINFTTPNNLHDYNTIPA